MSRPGSVIWFAAHEARLSWRDWLALMTAGHRRRAVTVAFVFVAFVLFLHFVASLVLGSAADPANTRVLLTITGMLLMAFSLMLSQALESVTRAFYARGDLDLVLASPVAAGRLFAVRIGGIAAVVAVQSLVLAVPILDVLVWRDGMRWLGGYAVIAALAMDAAAASVVLAGVLFRAIGPRRTRLLAQILAAIVGAGFVIGVQFAAILSVGSAAPLGGLQSPALAKLAPGAGSVLWWPARAVAGDPLPLAALLSLSTAALAAAIRYFAPRFRRLALTAGAVSEPVRRRRIPAATFRNAAPGEALRRKEWTLLLRDPWLLSQTLMQLLYLLPAAFLLWRSFYDGGEAAPLLVPVFIMTAGQLAGGLAWLALSGEDAHELILSAPVSPGRVLRAKIEAVFAGIALVLGPFLLVLAVFAPFAALVAALGVAAAAASSTAIQLWFRTQARRSLFRRRQQSSRVATFAEALCSIGWAGTGAVAATGTWLAAVSGLVVLAMVGGAWLVSPTRGRLG